MPGVPPGRRVLEFGPCDGFILISSFAAVPDAASLRVVQHPDGNNMGNKKPGPIIFFMPDMPPALRREPVPPMEVPATAAGRSPAREAEPAAQSVEIKRIRIMIHRVEQRFSSPL